MLRSLKIAAALACAAMLSGCAGVLGALAGPPPTAAPLAATSIDEAGIDLVRDLFDVSLFGIDALIDSGRIQVGSPEARSLARVIRQISGFLGAADAAQKAGQATTYNESLRNARQALGQLRRAIGMPASEAAAVAQLERLAPPAVLGAGEYAAFADRLDGRGVSN
jgi:hypothetical protein